MMRPDSMDLRSGWCGSADAQKSLRAEQDRPDFATPPAVQPAAFMDPARFVFLDETATATTMARRCGPLFRIAG